MRPLCFDTLRVPLGVFGYRKRRQVGQGIAWQPPEPQKRPERKIRLVEEHPQDTPAGLLRQGYVHLLPRGLGSTIRRLQLDVANDLVAGNDQIITTSINLGPKELGGGDSLAPQVAEDVADQQMLQQLLAVCG